jgi:hypothetical protein
MTPGARTRTGHRSGTSRRVADLRPVYPLCEPGHRTGLIPLNPN